MPGQVEPARAKLDSSCSYLLLSDFRDEPSFDDLSFDELSLLELSFEELSLDELSFDELSLAEPSDFDFSSFFESLSPLSDEVGAWDLFA